MKNKALIRVGVGILLPDEIFNHARKLEYKLSKKFGVICGLQQTPHIALMPSFEIKEEELPILEEYTNSLCISNQSFTINIDKIGYFEPLVAFMDIQDNKNLKSLHLKFLKELRKSFSIKNLFIGENIKFHSTLSYKDFDEEIFHHIKEFLSPENIDFSFKFNRIGIFYNLPNSDNWIVYKKYQINSKII